MCKKTQIGVVLQQHYNNPKQLGFDIFNCVLKLNLNQIDCILFDIRDINGRLFIDVDSDQGIPQRAFFPYFNQLRKLCLENNITLYLGIPCFHNAIIDYDNVVLKDHSVISGRICPSSIRHRKETIDFLKTVERKYNKVLFFLPFFRYPPLSRGLSCFCENCKMQWKNRYKTELTEADIINDFNTFNQWQDIKNENMYQFIKQIKEETGYYLAPEIDIDPTRGLYEGVSINDCQNINELNEYVDEYIIHFYDKSGYQVLKKDLQSQNGIINSYSFFRYLYSCRKPYSLFFWNNEPVFEEIKTKYSVAEKVNAKTVFYLVNDKEVNVINELLDWRHKT